MYSRANIYNTARKPTRYRRVVINLKVGRRIEKHNTIIYLIGDDLTIITKG